MRTLSKFICSRADNRYGCSRLALSHFVIIIPKRVPGRRCGRDVFPCQRMNIVIKEASW